jgi:hypothetical protein
LNRLSFPTISTISATSLEGFKSSNDVVVVGYLTPDDKDSHEALSSLAEAMRADYLFGITHDSALANAEQVDMPGIAMYKAFDEGKKVLHLAHDIDQMSASLRAAARPLVIDFVSELHEDYLDVSQRNYRARQWLMGQSSFLLFRLVFLSGIFSQTLRKNELGYTNSSNRWRRSINKRFNLASPTQTLLTTSWMIYISGLDAYRHLRSVSR